MDQPRLFDPADADPGRHTDPVAWPARLRAASDDARALVADVPPDRLHAAPAPGAWSVAQCLDHLVRTGAPLLPGLTHAVERLERAGARTSEPVPLGRVGRWMAVSQRPGGRKVKTPPLYRPASPDVVPPSPTAADDVLAPFLDLQREFERLAVRAHGLALASARVASPALPLLRLNVAAWMEVTLAHTLRHLAQARRAATAVSAHAGACTDPSPPHADA